MILFVPVAPENVFMFCYEIISILFHSDDPFDFFSMGNSSAIIAKRLPRMDLYIKHNNLSK